MFGKSKMVLLSATILVSAGVASAFLITRGSAQSPASIPKEQKQHRGPRGSRNVSVRPETIGVRQQLGKRFEQSQHDSSVVDGTLLIDNNPVRVSIKRDQTDAGENVEIELRNEPRVLSWRHEDGPKSSTNDLSQAQRLLIERLVFDSADYFVLAQVRGASYYTVARNVRPDEVGDADGYSGPLWDVVRVDDPEKEEQKRPLSPWRLFYINSETHLIEKIVSEEQGERIETVFSDWTDVAGERVPGRVTWKSGTQILMELSLKTFTHAAR